MADRYSPVTLQVGSNKVRCASNRRYAIAQLVRDDRKNPQGNYRLKVLFRSNTAKYIADKVRTLGGYSFVFDLKTGDKLWENTASEWPTAEQAILNSQTEV